MIPARQLLSHLKIGQFGWLVKGLFFCWAMCLAGLVGAQVAVPPLSARVTDLTTTLTADQKTKLEQTLKDFEAKKGSQIAVLILPSTAPETIEQYSLRVAEQWKLGRKKVDDGALLIVAKNDKALRIEVGYGLEGALSDVVSKRIISEIITPKFKQGDFYGGVKDGIDSMINIVQGESLPQAQSNKDSNAITLEPYIPVLLVVALVAGRILRLLFGRLPAAIATGGITALLAWILVSTLSVTLIAGALALVFTLLGGRGGLGGALYGGGFGRRGGNRDDDFRGGGGGFGGGGASGRW